MTKIKNLLSMEKIVEMKDLAYSEKNLLDASKAMIDYKAEKATKELEENIDIEVRLAIQEALDDFYEIMFDIADNTVTLEKRKEEKKAAKRAKQEKRAAKKETRAKEIKITKSKRELGVITPKAPQNRHLSKDVIRSKKDNTKNTMNRIAKANEIPSYVKVVRNLAIAKAEAKIKITEAKTVYDKLTKTTSTSFRNLFSASEIARIAEIEIELFEANDNLHDAITEYENICTQLEEAKEVLNLEVNKFNSFKNTMIAIFINKTHKASNKSNRKTKYSGFCDSRKINRAAIRVNRDNNTSRINAIRKYVLNRMNKFNNDARGLNDMLAISVASYDLLISLKIYSKFNRANKAKTLYIENDKLFYDEPRQQAKGEIINVKYLETAECGSNMGSKLHDEKADINVIGELCSEPRMLAFNRDLKYGLYETGFVVDRINMEINKDSQIASQRFCRSLEGTVQMFRYFDVDAEESSYVVESYDQYGNVDETTVRKTGIKNMPLCAMTVPAYTEFDANGARIEWNTHKKLSEDVIVFQFSPKGMSMKARAATEKMASTYAINGLFIGKDKDGNKVAYETLEGLKASGNAPVGVYRGHFCSTSTLKHGVIFFTRMNCSLEEYDNALNGVMSDSFKAARDEKWRQLDEITQGALDSTIKELEDKRLSSVQGDVAIQPNKYSKVFVRPGLIAATPVIPFGKIRNMFIVKDDILTEEEFGDQNESIKAIMRAMGIDNNFSDGAGIVSLKQIRQAVEFVSDKYYTDKQIMSLGLQLRADLVTLKGFFRVYDENMLLERGIVLLRLMAKAIDIYCEQSSEYVSMGIKRHYTGEELVSMLEDPTQRPIAEFIIKNTDLMATKNELKMVNWKKLEEPDAAANLYLVDAQKASESETSNQMLNKTLDMFEDETKQMVEAMADEDAYNMTDIDQARDIRFNNKCTGIGSRPLDAIFALDPDNAKKDAGLMTSYYTNTVDSAKAKIARCRVDTKSPYLVATPDDYVLGSYFNAEGNWKQLNLLGSRKVMDYSPEQISNNKKGSEVKCIEVYSAKINKDIAEQIEDLRADGFYSEDDLAKIETSLRVQTMLKYPTQGRKEYVFVFFVSNKEMKARISDAKDSGLISNSREKALLNFYFKCPMSCIIIAADNSLKNQLAGFDFDGDAVVTVPRILSEDNDGHLVYGILYDNKIINDYTSILVKKYIKNGGKYTCTCIVYDKPEYRYGRKPVQHDLSSVNNNTGRNRKYRNSTRKATYVEDNAMLKEIQEAFGYPTFGYDAIDFLGKPYVPNYEEIQDKLGLYHACNTVGDDIGMTIVLCSVIVMTSIDGVMFKDDVFDYELFQDLFSPLKPGVVNGMIYHPATLEYKSVFNSVLYDEVHNDDIIRRISVVNRFGIEREYYRVDKNVINKFCSRVSRLRRDVTKAEWKALVEDFNHITRALGESSIDAKKDVTKTLGRTVFNIVDRMVRCMGNIKNKHIDSNVDDIRTDKGRAKDFEFDMYSRFVDNSYYIVTDDPIGDIKIKMAEIYESAINTVRMSIINDRTNYDSYRQYNTGMKFEYENTDLANHNYISYIIKSNIPGNNVPKLSKFEKELMLNGIINVAKLDGINNVKDVVKMAIEDAFFDSSIYNSREIKALQEETRRLESYNFARNYNARLNTVMNTYGELFILERCNLDTIPVVLKPVLDCRNYLTKENEGEYFSFTDGVCDFDQDFELVDNYTGSAQYRNGELVVDYDPTNSRITANEKVLTLNIEAFAKDKGVSINSVDFDSTGEDIDEGTSWGFNVINDRMSNLYFKEDRYFDDYGESYAALTLVDEDDNTVALISQTLDNDAWKALIGKRFSGCMLVGYTYDREERRTNSRAKTVFREYKYMINGEAF